MRPLSHAPLHRLAGIAAMLLAMAAPGLDAQAVPTRPRLDAKADTNDWGAYFDHGVKALRLRTDEDYGAAFYWAARLNPERAEPLFAQWVAFHMRDYDRWLGYLMGKPEILARRDVIAADSLRLRARIRNPFVAQSLEVVLYDQLPGTFARTDLTNGWLAYGKGELRRAARLFADGIARDPSRHAFARDTRAQVLVAMRQYDSALVEMRALRAELERREETSTTLVYQSKEFVDYAIGFLEGVRGNERGAREAMQRALGENLGFHPAHLFLGDEALRASDVATAIYEYEEALAVDSTDAVLHHHYGLALMRVGRLDEAKAALRKAVTLEPFYAAPWLQLARVLDKQRDLAAARAAYRQYVATAPRSEAGRLGDARARLAELDAAGASR